MTRDEEVNNAFMNWLAEYEAQQPNPEQILTLGTVEPGGVALTMDEVERCARYLAAVGLIRGAGAMGRKMPFRAWLTDDGLRCVSEFGGDVAAWNRSRQPSYTDQSVNVQAGRDAQVAAHSSYVNQAQGESSVNVEKLVEATQGVREILPALAGVEGVDAVEVEGVVAEIEAEASVDKPDHGKLRRLGTRLKDLLGPAAAGLTIGKFVVAGIAAALV